MFHEIFAITIINGLYLLLDEINKEILHVKKLEYKNIKKVAWISISKKSESNE